MDTRIAPITEEQAERCVGNIKRIFLEKKRAVSGDGQMGTLLHGVELWVEPSDSGSKRSCRYLLRGDNGKVQVIMELLSNGSCPPTLLDPPNQ